MKKLDLKTLVSIGLLIGINIVLSRFVSIKALNFKISLTFLTLVVAAYLYGTFSACIVAFFGDFIGALLFPVGPYNFLLSFTAVLSAIVYGLFLYNNLSNKRILISCFINRFIISLFINTFIISKMYEMNFKALFITRLSSSAIMFVVEIAVIKLLEGFLKRIRMI